LNSVNKSKVKLQTFTYSVTTSNNTVYIAHAHFIYPQYNVDHFAIILVEDVTRVPDTRMWKAMLVTLNPDRSSHFLVGAFGECIREAMMILLMTITHMMRERALGLVTAICSSVILDGHLLH